MRIDRSTFIKVEKRFRVYDTLYVGVLFSESVVVVLVALEFIRLGMSALVHAANIYDGKAGMKLIDKVFNKYQLKKIWADNTYRGEFVKYAKEKYNCDIEINMKNNQD